LEEASKSKNLLFAGSVSKKGQAKPALFWSKGNKTPRPDGFSFGLHGLTAKLYFPFKPKTNQQK
jgi:hypothetical protein